MPVLYAPIRTCERPKPNAKTIKVLVDSGASVTPVRSLLLKKIRHNKTSIMHWRMHGGNFHTEYCSKLQLSLPDCSDQKLIKRSGYINDSTTDFHYDIIIGHDLLKELGIC